MLEAAILSIIILLLCVIFLCVKILFKKNGAFPNTHVGGQPALMKKGIQCVQGQDCEACFQANLSERMKCIKIN